MPEVVVFDAGEFLLAGFELELEKVDRRLLVSNVYLQTEGGDNDACLPCKK